jgi:hypothetical protein
MGAKYVGELFFFCAEPGNNDELSDPVSCDTYFALEVNSTHDSKQGFIESATIAKSSMKELKLLLLQLPPLGWPSCN